MTDVPTEDAAASKTVAAIDVGSNALRMVIAQVDPAGHVEVIERLQRAVRLGQDTFRRGRLGGQSMRAAVAVLRDFQKLLDLYRVERIRAVATSAVREAVNADTFLDRVFMATGLNLEVIAPSEESRLTVSAVRQALGTAPGVEHQEALIADVGGGSTLLTVLKEGEIANSLSLRLGSIRLQEMLSTSGEPPERSADLLRHHIANMIATSEGAFPMKSIRSFVALGGDARFTARQVGKPADSSELSTVALDDFEELVGKCERHSAEELGRRYGLPYAEAETLVPALFVYQDLLHRTEATQMVVSGVSMRDGLLLDLARSVTGEEDKAVLEGVIHSATTLAEKYRVDMQHARSVAGIAVILFDELAADHGLGRRHRLLLQAAGLLHEVGGFVSSLAHHKHSYYLISNSEIFGLSPREVEMVAHVGRYHRRSSPKPSHLQYMSLARERRVVVNKLAAILRLADAICRSQVRPDHPLRFERQGDEFIIYVSGVSDLILEQRSAANKGDLFEDIYGMRIRLEEG